MMGGLQECGGGYVFRSLPVIEQKHIEWAIVQSLVVLLAPFWINAFIQILMVRMGQILLDERKVYRVRAKHFTSIFVSLDILSSLVQQRGGLMASGKKEPDMLRNGLNIYMADMGLQQFIILIFISMVIHLQTKVTQQEQGPSSPTKGF